MIWYGVLRCIDINSSLSGSGALLLIGPFRGASDAQIFSEDLGTVGVQASKYINSQTDRIAPLAAE